MLTCLQSATLLGCGGGGSTTPPSYDQTVLKDHPTAYWKLNETSGTTAIDSSTSGWNGTYQGAVSPGQTDNEGHSFAGFSGGYVSASAADYSPLYQTGSFSIEAWYRGDSSMTSRPEVVMAKGTDENPHDNGGILLYARPSAQIFLADGSAVSLVAPTATSAGTWHYCVATWNSTAGQAVEYLDGAQISVIKQSFSIVANGNPFTIGEQALSGYNYTFSGLISDVAIYSYALNSDQIAKHFAAGKLSHPSE